MSKQDYLDDVHSRMLRVTEDLRAIQRELNCAAMQAPGDPELMEALTQLPEIESIEVLKSALDQILETGCLIKDLEVGLLDFPSVIDNEEVYLCWKVGEDRIRYYHKQSEGFAGRKPLDPRDLGPGDKVQ